MPRPAAGLADWLPMQIVELRNAVGDCHLVDQVELVGKREGQSSALSAAAETPAAKSARTAFAAAGTCAGRAAFRWWRWLIALSALAGETFPECRPRRFGRRLAGQRLGEIKSPAECVPSRFLEVQRPKVDRDKGAIFVTNETIRKGSFQRLAGGRNIALGIVNRLPDIFGAKPEVGLVERLPVTADLEDVARIGPEVRIAAGECRHRHRLTGRKIENADVGRFDERITQLLKARRSLLPVPARCQVEPLALATS